jgi:hypothetical protein
VKNAEQDHEKYQQQSKQPQGFIIQETENPAGYFVEISPDGIQKAKDTDDDLQKRMDGLQGHLKQMESAREQGAAEAEAAKIRIKCLQIAMRIISGDEVPPEDHKFLAEHDPELYAEAMSRRMPKEDPYKHERLSEDKKPDIFNMTGDPVEVKSVSFGNIEIAAENSNANIEQ